MDTSIEKWRSRWDNALLEYLMFEMMEETPRFGGEIVKFAKSNFSSEIKIPTIYAILNRGADWGLLTEMKQEKTATTRGIKRRYFGVTDKGRIYLKQIRLVIAQSMSLIDRQQEMIK